MEAQSMERISLPEIDLCLLPWRSLSGGGDDRISDHKQLYLESQQFKKLREACQHLGHFCVANHGVHHDLIHSALSLALRPANADLNSRSLITKGKIKPNITKCGAHFRNSLAKLKIEMAELSQRIVKLIICSLGLDVSKHYNSQPFVSFEGLLRVACYKEEEAEAEAKRNLGCISLRYMEDAGVFYVRQKCGNWIEAEASAGCFMVDLGASLHMWTNGTYLSTQHRLMPSPSPNPKARPCITYFLDFGESSQICCLPELLDEDNKDKYPSHARSPPLR